MKRPITGVVALLAGAFIAHSQGTVGFGNYGNPYNGGTYITVSFFGTLLGGTDIGPPPTTANFASETANGDEWTVALYGAPLGGTPVQLYDASGIPVQATLAPGGGGDDKPGTWESGDAGLIPGTTPGGSGIVQLYAWYNEGGVLSNYTAALDAGVPTGFSAVATVNDLGGPQTGLPPPVPLPIGELGSFSLSIPPVANGALSGAAFLDPSAFTSLGVFDPATNVVVDVSSKQMSGGATFVGADVTQAGTSMLVFAFSSFSLNSGMSITFTNYMGVSGVAFLSQGDMTIGGVITASGQVGGGAGEGGWGTGGVGGGGGGFGGSGGDGWGSADGNGVGGGSYSPDITSGLACGSSGGTGGSDPNVGAPGGPGGSGGGAVQFAANGSFSLTGSILANGSGGQDSAPVDDYTLTSYPPPYWGAGGGGSGGCILVQAGNVTINSGATLSANGGVGGPQEDFIFANPNTFAIYGAEFPGGGGGGGRIVLACLDSGSANGSITAFGGTVNGPGFGNAGTFIFVQNVLVPAFPSIATSLASSGDLVLSWPSSATNYVLQTSPVLSAGAVWKTVTGAVVVGNTFVLTNQTQGPAGFFRLMLQ